MCMLSDDVMRKEITVCQKDQLSKRFICDNAMIHDDELILINAELEGKTWDVVHFPLSTVESYYIKTIKNSMTKGQIQNKMREIYYRPVGAPDSYSKLEVLKGELEMCLYNLAIKELRDEDKQ